MNEEERLRKVIRQAVKENGILLKSMYKTDYLTEKVELILVNAILDEFDAEFEMAWAYNDLANS